MTEAWLSNENHDTAGIYEIRIQGHLPDKWEVWFEGLSIRRESDGTTTLHGPVTDQSALHSILLKIRNVNLSLISVNRIETDKEGGPSIDH